MKTVLVVDDSDTIIDIVVAILKNDYKVKVAMDAKTAYNICINNPPDLILLDIMMPEINGYTLCRQLKADTKTESIPVIFVTAMDSSEDETFGLSLGAVDYITKPICPAILKARVKTQIKLSQYTIELEKQIKERTKELYDSRLDIIRRLGRASEYKDNETGIHVKRMSMVSYILAKAHGLPLDECELLLNAAPMHDLGKIGIPDNILAKPHSLTPPEWKIMKTHTYIGYKLLSDSKNPLLELAAEIAYCHHERWDGSGYPRKLKEDNIPIGARIVSLADVYDALVSKRPYKEAWAIEDCVEYIKKHSGSIFDPELVKTFLNCLEEIKTVYQTSTK